MAGYKYIDENRFIQDNSIAPIELTHLPQPPDFRDIYDKQINEFLLSSMPKSHKDMGKCDC